MERISYFDAKTTDATKMKSITDCQIILAEIKFNADRIRDQIKCNIGNAEWKDHAERAADVLEHKGRMVVLKMAQLEEDDAKKDAKKKELPDYAKTAITFKNAARIILSEHELDKVKAYISMTKGDK